MNIKPLSSNPSFGIYLKTVKKPYGYMTQGKYKGHIIDIYSSFDGNNLLKHKLFYVRNAAGNWIKSKLNFYNNGKKIGVARCGIN